ncbi:hypothetical protein T265_05965 [Opisthorchis viverrini]|uniref:Uncharacterized protein n=1 Tax=Opisthorchis viverrini TaxID=6198 RepID=A0A074ZTW4_OPIVI|nr:hypothetical protein T265_05965 [Opisthorchis viverrini]KER26830.1 hypothetical protein T265_05965 [Opisthorchis viverrini]
MTTSISSITEDVDPVASIQLFQKYEGQNGMGSEAEKVGRETLPQGENTFLSYNLEEDVLKDERRIRERIMARQFFTEFLQQETFLGLKRITT